MKKGSISFLKSFYTLQIFNVMYKNENLAKILIEFIIILEII